MFRPRRVAALAVVAAALSLSACTNNDADAADVVDAMTDAGVPQDMANCIGDGVEAADFSQDELNDLAAEDSGNPEDWPSGTGEPMTSILEECISGEGSGDEDPADGTDSDSTTTTTEADSN
jgi:hypothetical protein